MSIGIKREELDQVALDAMSKALRESGEENARLRRRVADLEDFLRGAAKQFGAMAGEQKP